MSLRFEWDDVKSATNFDKHGVSFQEAATAFGDPLSLTIADPDHSGSDEQRHILLGQSFQGRLLVVVHVERGDTIRIISARSATRRERQDYEEE
jgi:uncharacterized DUF497 family protein